jgi:hypothetical protein
MNAEQYRALVAKLEAIQEAAPDDDAQQIALAASNTQAEPADGTTVTGDVYGNDKIYKIEAPTFSQAYAKAKKMGLKKFKWCGIYAVKDAVKPQPVKPQPKPVDTLPTTRTGVVPEPNDWKGRLQAGERNLI